MPVSLLTALSHFATIWAWERLSVPLLPPFPSLLEAETDLQPHHRVAPRLLRLESASREAGSLPVGDARAPLSQGHNAGPLGSE